MGIVTVSLVADGTTADVADVNTPINTIVTEINGNLDNNNIKAAAGIDPTKLASTGFLAERTAWTPTITASTGAFTTTSASGRYVTIGKNILFEVQITITTVGTGSGVIFTLPVGLKPGNAGFIGSGREDAITGKMLQVKASGLSAGAVSYYDNTSPSSSGMILRINGHYETT